MSTSSLYLLDLNLSQLGAEGSTFLVFAFIHVMHIAVSSYPAGLLPLSLLLLPFFPFE